MVQLLQHVLPASALQPLRWGYLSLMGATYQFAVGR